MIVSYPRSSLEVSVYAVKVDAPVFDFEWQGVVDTSGQVVETLVSTAEGIDEETVEPEPIKTPADTPTPVPVPCNAANFQADLTIPDRTKFAPGVSFIKSWRLKNIGSCAWGTDYDLVFLEGNRMDGKKAVTLPQVIRPGETLDISVVLTSPDESGKHRGYWMFRSKDGEWFGIGGAANQAFWVEIKVLETQGDYGRGRKTQDLQTWDKSPSRWL